MVKGTVERVVQNKFGYGVLVNGSWYNSKFEIKCDEGDEVMFDDGGKNYCNKLKVITAAEEGGGAKSAPKKGGTYYRGKFPIDQGDGQRSIIRQNALTNAVKYLTEFHDLDMGKAPPDHMRNGEAIIEIARLFEAYTAGDLDREAQEQLNESFSQ